MISGGYKSAPFKAPGQQRLIASGAAFPLLRVGGRLPVSSRLSMSELKDITVRSTAVVPGLAATGSTPVLLNGVAQGTTASTRLGRRITMKSLYLHWFLQVAAGTTGATPIRLLVVYDAQTNATAPAITDIVLTDEIMAPMNLSNSRRFKVLCDQTWDCLGTAGPQSLVLKKYIKLNMNTEFNNGSAGTVGDIQTGSIYIITWSGNGLGVGGPNSVLYSRIRFQDS